MVNSCVPSLICVLRMEKRVFSNSMLLIITYSFIYDNTGILNVNILVEKILLKYQNVIKFSDSFIS